MASIVYVSCGEQKEIVGFEMDQASGGLHEISRTKVPGTSEPSPGSLPLAVSPDRRFLYAGLRTAPFPLVTFAIEPGSFALRLAGSAKLPGSMCYLSTDGSGTRLFSASYHGAVLGVAPIEDGIARDAAQVIATPPKAHCALPSPDGEFVYAACLGGDVIVALPFDGTTLDGTPNPVARTSRGAGPRHLAFAAGGRRLYCINELDGTLNAYDRNASTGMLEELQSVSGHPVSGKAAAADIHLTPNERFLYTSERRTDTLAAYRVDADTGRLSVIGHVPSEPEPRGFAIEPQGRFLFCAGLKSGTVGTYAIDPVSGRLERTSVVDAGPSANWVEVLEL